MQIETELSTQEPHIIHSEQIYNTDFVSDRYDLCKRTLENWRTTGRGPKYIKVGKLVRYKGRHLLEWEESNTLDHSGQEGLPK